MITQVQKQHVAHVQVHPHAGATAVAHMGMRVTQDDNGVHHWGRVLLHTFKAQNMTF